MVPGEVVARDRAGNGIQRGSLVLDSEGNVLVSEDESDKQGCC